VKLKYRDVDYTIAQGIGKQLWKWSVTIGGLTFEGHAASKSQAISAAERAIDRDLAPKKLRLVPPDRE
jgi:hypothetical protein